MSQINPFVACIELARYAKLRGVAFRVLPDGTMETDSAEETVELHKAVLRDLRKQANPDRKPSDPDNLSDDTKRFLYRVIDPATSEEIAETANISKKSLPPLIRGLNVWAEHRGLNLDDLLTRTQKSVKGKPVSTYQLTEKGREKFAPFLPLLKREMETRTSDGVESVRKPTGLAKVAGRLCLPHGRVITVSEDGRYARCEHADNEPYCNGKTLLAWAISLDG